MIPHTSAEAEQAVLGSLLMDPDSWADAADLFTPALFAAVPAHAEIAAEIQTLLRANKPADPVLVSQRLAARGAGIEPATVLGLAQAMGTSGNVRHYLATLESLWQTREAKRIARELMAAPPDVSGAELVARFAERLSAIETRSAKPPKRLAEEMFARLERRERIQKDPSLLQAWPSGFPVLDALTGGFKPGNLFTIAARPGVGKTAFMTSVFKALAARGVGVGVFMLEDYADAVADRSLMREGKIPSTLMRDAIPWGKEMWSRASAACEAVADWPVYVDDQHGRTIHDIAGAMRRMNRQHGVKVFFLDNLAEVVLDREDRAEERLDRALGRISKTYRDTAKALGAAPVLIVHLNRDVEKQSGRKPRMSDLKNSGEIEDASHVVAMLSRAQDSDVMGVDVVKNRSGPCGEVGLVYDREFMVVKNPDPRRAA